MCVCAYARRTPRTQASITPLRKLPPLDQVCCKESHQTQRTSIIGLAFSFLSSLLIVQLSARNCVARYLGILGHLFSVRHFVDFQECPVPGATFKGIARPNPSADRRAKSNTDSPRRVGPVLDFATENKDPHFSTILGPQYIRLCNCQV